MEGGEGALAPCPICEGTGVGRVAPAGIPCGYCFGRGRVPQALVAEVRAAQRLARTAAWVLRAVATWRREVEGA